MLGDGDDIFLFSDLNVPGLNWRAHDDLANVFVPINVTGRNQRIVTDSILGSGLYQLVDNANSYGHVFDTVFASRYEEVTILCPAPPICDGFGSSRSHHPVELIYNRRPLIKSSNIGTKLNFKAVDYNAVVEKLAEVDWTSTLSTDDPNCALDEFYRHIRAVIDELVPRKSNKKKSGPWLTPALSRLRNRKRSVGRKAAKTKQPCDKDAYNKLNFEFVRANQLAYEQYMKNIGEKLKTDPAKFWTVIDKKRNCNGLPETMTLGDKTAQGCDETANLLASHFSSVFPPQAVPPMKL